jgi:hypothetical protein
MTTKPDVFIIETLDPDDEGNGRFEGVFLSQMLRLHGKSPKYRYVRTRSEFAQAVKSFGASRYRYLHISSHGNPDGICTTNQDFIGNEDLAAMLKPHIDERRIFASACQVASESMAQSVIPESGCISVVGPTKEILFTEAAVVWASIYHLVLTEDAKRMTGEVLREKLMKVCELFNVQFAYYSRTTRRTCGYTQNLLDR